MRVSPLCLGTMTFGEEWGWGSSEEESRKVFDAYAERGGNFLDTANKYTEGTSERIVGELVRSDRERFVIATKFTLTTRPDSRSKRSSCDRGARTSMSLCWPWPGCRARSTTAELSPRSPEPRGGVGRGTSPLPCGRSLELAKPVGNLRSDRGRETAPERS